MALLQKHSAALSWFVGIVGVFLFPWGGFFLLPVALDLWEYRLGTNPGLEPEAGAAHVPRAS